jgi:hypothetical protein
LIRLRRNGLRQYVKENYKRLGFVKIEGPYQQGPDFRLSTKKRWAWAEVETDWRNYRKHGHHLDPDFDRAKYLILLSAEDPSPDKLRGLPSQIIHIDQEHFLSWFKVAVSGPQMQDLRVGLVAGFMQQHWVGICGDRDRDMATCPNCDACAYFGEGIFGEARPFFRALAVRFIALHALTEHQELDLRATSRAALQRFVEKNPPG